MEINVSGGTFSITAEGLSDDNPYIQRIELNGMPYEKGYIDFKDISEGGSLKFIMGPEPAKWY